MGLVSIRSICIVVTSRPLENERQSKFVRLCNRWVLRIRNLVLPFSGFLLFNYLFADRKLDLAFLIDGSASMSNAGFEATKVFIKALYSNFPIGEDSTHVALVVYGKDSLVVFNLIGNTDKESIGKKLLNTANPRSDGNFMGKGLKTVKEKVFDVSARPGGHQVLVVLVAGKSMDDAQAPSRILRDEGVKIFCIAIDDQVDVDQLRDIVSVPEEDHLAATSSEQLGKLLSPMVQNIRKGNPRRYLL